MRYVTAAISVIALLAVLIFAVQNRESVPVAFLAWSLSMPKVFLILGTYLFGMVSGWGLLQVLRRAF